MGTAAAAGDTVSVPEPCPGKGRSKRLGSSKMTPEWCQNPSRSCQRGAFAGHSPVGGIHRGASAPDAAEAAVPAVGEQRALPRDCLDHALQLQNAATCWL